MEYINDGKSFFSWHGLTAAALLKRCAQATPEQAAAMSHAASLMHAGEPVTVEEWAAAERASNEIERRLICSFVGPVRQNRHGHPWGGSHPALRKAPQ
jgi:hypothetical protein